MGTFRDRIVELRRVKASDLRRNPQNWRLHPEGQRSALSAVLQSIGFVGALAGRQMKDHVELLDGHLRADIADDSEVPVLILDLNDTEAAQMLVTFDPLGSLALVDDSKLSHIRDNIVLDENAESRRMIADLQTKVIEEAEASGEGEHEVDGMALTPHEHYDYLVVLATTTQEWNVLCERIGLEPEKRRRGSMGTCRAIRASKLIERITPAPAKKKATA